MNAVEILKAEHREVEDWFTQFFATDDAARKHALARNICKAIEVHARIEAEIFYPAFLDGTGNEDLHDDAVDDHDTAMELIARIATSTGPQEDDFFNAKVKVLAETIRDHVRDEEMPGGMFEQALNAGLDLDLIGLELEHRKIELMEGAPAGSLNWGAAGQTSQADEELAAARENDRTSGHALLKRASR